MSRLGLCLLFVSGDGDGFGTGDIVITLPQQLGTNVVELIGVHGQFAESKGGQAVGLDCVESIAESLMG